MAIERCLASAAVPKWNVEKFEGMKMQKKGKDGDTEPGSRLEKGERDAIRDLMERIEAKLDMLLGAPVKDAKLDVKLTAKQHAALQMVVAGCSNREIAERFGVTENTAKVHVRALAAKLEVSSRAQIVARTVSYLQQEDPLVYLTKSRGLPLDWWEKYGDVPPEGDPYAHLYRYEP